METTAIPPDKIISNVIRYDRKVTSYKLALLRALGDVALSFPDLTLSSQPVAIPLRVLAEFWIAYYWLFVDPDRPVLQGTRPIKNGQPSQDMDFRGVLTELRVAWEGLLGTKSGPADGYILINELRLPRKQLLYPLPLVETYSRALKTISGTLEHPICYAGPAGEKWSIFPRPVPFREQPVTRCQSLVLCLKIAVCW